MTEKRVTLVVYGADRESWQGGHLHITVMDIFGSSQRKRILSKKVKGSPVELRLQVPFDAGQLYGIDVAARHHRPAWYLLRRQDFLRGEEPVERDDIIVRLMLIPKRVVSSDIAVGHGRLEAIGSPLVAPGRGVTADEFAVLSPAAKMALLNIEAKLRQTHVDGMALLPLVAAVRRVDVDRLFLFIHAEAKDAIERSRDFATAPGHGAPKGVPRLPAHPDSWKHTRYGEGNVQLSFSRSAELVADGAGGALCHSVDVDIDLGRGLKHVVEWLENNVFKPGHTTDQSLVYGLLFNQGILPQYTLDPVSGTTAPPLVAAPATTRKRPTPSAQRSRGGIRRARARGGR